MKLSSVYASRDHFDFLMSCLFDGILAGDHRADLHQSGLTDATIGVQKIRSVPPAMIDPLLGFRATTVRSAYVIPFAYPDGGWMDHVKLKVFTDEGTADVRGDHVEGAAQGWRYNSGRRKYLIRRAAPRRLFFPVAVLAAACEDPTPLWVCEGEKKALAVAQLGVPAVGLESAWGWPLKGTRELLPDFGFLRLRGRTVELLPDSDVQTNRLIAQSMWRLAEALRRAGAHPRLVLLPPGVKGADDFLQRPA